MNICRSSWCDYVDSTRLRNITVSTDLRIANLQTAVNLTWSPDLPHSQRKNRPSKKIWCPRLTQRRANFQDPISLAGKYAGKSGKWMEMGNHIRSYQVHILVSDCLPKRRIGRMISHVLMYCACFVKLRAAYRIRSPCIWTSTCVHICSISNIIHLVKYAQLYIQCVCTHHVQYYGHKHIHIN